MGSVADAIRIPPTSLEPSAMFMHTVCPHTRVPHGQHLHLFCGRADLRLWRRTKEPLVESERGEWKSWFKAQHLENKDDGIWSHHFMGNRWGNSRNNVRLYFLGSKITADGDCSHEIKRCLLLERKVMTNLDSILKSRDITLSTKVHIVRDMVFSSSHIEM